MGNWKLLPVVLAGVLVCACSSDNGGSGNDDGGGGGGGGDGGGGDSARIVNADVYCDGTASAWDWLFVMEADTEGSGGPVRAEIIQGGDDFGSYNLDEIDDGYWYREEWEDDLWIDCEGGPIRVTFTFEDDEVTLTY